MRYKRILPVLFAALLLAALLGACGEGILPPKETPAPTAKPMPTPTPTPTPTPYSGEIASLEIAQVYDGDGARFLTDTLVERRDTAVYVRLSSPLGHAPDERDSLAIGRGSEIVGVYAADETSTRECLCFYLTGEDAAALEAGDYTFSAVVDGVQFSRRAELIATRPLDVLLVPILGSFSGATSYPAENWKEAAEALRTTLPLSDGGFRAVTAPGLTLTAEGYDLRTGDGLVRAWEALRERAGLLEGYDLILGFVSGGMGESGARVCFGRDGVALLDASSESLSEALAIFAAQTLGVAEAQDEAARWTALASQLAAERLRTELEPTLRVSGLLYPDGTVALRPLCTGAGWGAGRTATPFDANGSYALVYGDEDGTVLRREAFTPDFLWAGENAPMLGAAPIELLSSVPAGATTLRLVGPVQAEADGETEASEDAEGESAEGEPYTEGELFFAVLPAEPYESSFVSVPNVEELRGTARVEWETVQTREVEEPEEEAPEEKEEDDEEEPPAPPLPDPSYELYMCYDGLRLLVYRGGLRYAELDMPSLPKPERFYFTLLTCGGRTSTVTQSPELSMN